MGILSQLLRPEQRVGLANNPPPWLIHALNLSTTATDTATGINITAETALQLPAVLAAVRVLSESVASLPFLVYERQERGKRRATEHYLYPILHNAPNPEMTAFEFWELAMQHLPVWGDFFANAVRDGGGRVRQLWPLRPDRMEEIKRADDKRLRYGYRMPDGQLRWLWPNEILHIRGMGSDGIRGRSLIGLARQSVSLGLAAEEFGARFFGNGARPGMVLEHPGHLSDDAHERLRRSWETRHQGLSNAQRVAILEEGMQIEQIGIPPEDAQFLETRRFQVDEIARVFRIPPHMLGELERATFCLPADVEVLTEIGPRSIADVKAGELVWSLDRQGMQLAQVKRSVCSGQDEILEIRTTNRVLRTNARHRILCRRQSPAPRPGPGGYQHIQWAEEYVPAGELKPGDTIVTLDSLPSEGATACPTRDLTIGFMEFCGILLGDGNIHKGCISIARAGAALYMDHYRDVIRQEFVSFGSRGNGRVREGIETAPVFLQEQERQTRFSSVLACEELTKLGLAGDARSKRVPGWVFGVTEEYRLALLRGFLDADGSVDKKGRISFASVNRALLSQIRHLCLSVGVPVTNLREQAVHTRLPNGRDFEGVCYYFTCSDPGANRRIWSHDPRYQERLLAGKPFERKGRNYPRYGGREFDLPGCGLSRIVSIEKQATEPVYDLEVDGAHSFVANGVVVHNSNIEHQGIEFVVYSLRPWLVRIEQRIWLDLLTPTERKRYFAEFLVDALLRGDFVARNQGYATARQWGWMSANDVRELENMNPVAGGDSYLVPLNMLESGSGMRAGAEER